MSKSKFSILAFTALTLCLVFTLSACSLFGSSEQTEPLPDLSEEAPEQQAKKNDEGLSPREIQYRDFAVTAEQKLISAVNDFEGKMNDFLPKVMDDAMDVNQLDSFLNGRKAILSACENIERLPLGSVPEKLLPYYENLFLQANKLRRFLYSILRDNATSLPDPYHQLKADIQAFDQKNAQYMDGIRNQGIEAANALGLFQRLDFTAIDQGNLNLQQTMNVHDLGLNWGVSRAAVMGVEGLQADFENQNELAYPVSFNDYSGKRFYHFNEYGQLDSYRYELNSKTGNAYNDLVDISPYAMRYYILDHFTQAMTPVDQGNGSFILEFDLASEHVTITGTNGAEVPITALITAKVKDK